MEKVIPVNIKRIYKDKDVTENFIEHCLNVLSVYLALKALYPAKGKLGYFTKSQLSYEKYEFFPSPLQDAYVHIKTSKDDKHFFLDYSRTLSRFLYSSAELKST